ncbi:MAG: LPS export ABC transporter periplasmic protein LptC [Flavobacteriaceae bacterium]
MRQIILNGILGAVLCIQPLFFSCSDSTAALKEMQSINTQPIGTAQNIRMIYTDSLEIQAILTAPLHVDYTNLSFQYAEFPKGLKVVFFDTQRNENTVTADYGLLYTATNLIDLRKNVVLESHDGSLLKTDQLFWDAENEWLFTERPFEFQNTDYDLNAVRLDTNKEFSKFQTGKLTGTIAVSEKSDSLNSL